MGLLPTRLYSYRRLQATGRANYPLDSSTFW